MVAGLLMAVALCLQVAYSVSSAWYCLCQTQLMLAFEVPRETTPPPTPGSSPQFKNNRFDFVFPIVFLRWYAAIFFQVLQILVLKLFLMPLDCQVSVDGYKVWLVEFLPDMKVIISWLALLIFVREI